MAGVTRREFIKYMTALFATAVIDPDFHEYIPEIRFKLESGGNCIFTEIDPNYGGIVNQVSVNNRKLGDPCTPYDVGRGLANAQFYEGPNSNSFLPYPWSPTLSGDHLNNSNPVEEMRGVRVNKKLIPNAVEFKVNGKEWFGNNEKSDLKFERVVSLTSLGVPLIIMHNLAIHTGNHSHAPWTQEILASYLTPELCEVVYYDDKPWTDKSHKKYKRQPLPNLKSYDTYHKLAVPTEGWIGLVDDESGMIFYMLFSPDNKHDIYSLLRTLYNANYLSLRQTYGHGPEEEKIFTILAFPVIDGDIGKIVYNIHEIHEKTCETFKSCHAPRELYNEFIEWLFKKYNIREREKKERERPLIP